MAETPISRQWDFLSEIRDAYNNDFPTIPTTQPDESTIRELTVRILKSGKGDGLGARLIEFCDVAELPVTIKTFLEKVYKDFPKPKPVPLPPKPGDEIATSPQDPSVDVSTNDLPSSTSQS